MWTFNFNEFLMSCSVSSLIYTVKKKLIDQLVYNLIENRNARFFTITVKQKEIVRKIVLTVIPKYMCYEVEQIFFF